MFCNPRITSRCNVFGAAPSASKLGGLLSHYSEARVVLAIKGAMTRLSAMQVPRCAVHVLVYFSSHQRKTDAPAKNSCHKTALRGSAAHLARKMPGGILA